MSRNTPRRRKRQASVLFKDSSETRESSRTICPDFPTKLDIIPPQTTIVRNIFAPEAYLRARTSSALYRRLDRGCMHATTQIIRSFRFHLSALSGGLPTPHVTACTNSKPSLRSVASPNPPSLAGAFSPEGVVGVYPLQVRYELRQRQGAGALEKRHAVLEAAVALHRVEVVVLRVPGDLKSAKAQQESWGCMFDRRAV